MPAPIFPYPSSPSFQYTYDSGTDTWIPMTGGGGGGAASQVQGNVASGTADSGNPIKTGGVANAAIPTSAANGQRVDDWSAISGAKVVAGVASSLTDGVASTLGFFFPTASGSGFRISGVSPYLVNAAGTMDRARGDTTGAYITAAPSAGTDRSITATTTSQQLMAANTSRHAFYVKNDSAVDVWINIGATAVATAGGGNLKIAANGGYFESPASATPSGVINICTTSATGAVSSREL